MKWKCVQSENKQTIPIEIERDWRFLNWFGENEQNQKQSNVFVYFSSLLFSQLRPDTANRATFFRSICSVFVGLSSMNTKFFRIGSNLLTISVNIVQTIHQTDPLFRNYVCCAQFIFVPQLTSSSEVNLLYNEYLWNARTILKLRNFEWTQKKAPQTLRNICSSKAIRLFILFLFFVETFIENWANVVIIAVTFYRINKQPAYAQASPF